MQCTVSLSDIHILLLSLSAAVGNIPLTRDMCHTQGGCAKQSTGGDQVADTRKAAVDLFGGNEYTCSGPSGALDNFSTHH